MKRVAIAVILVCSGCGGGGSGGGGGGGSAASTPVVGTVYKASAVNCYGGYLPTHYNVTGLDVGSYLHTDVDDRITVTATGYTRTMIATGAAGNCTITETADVADDSQASYYVYVTNRSFSTSGGSCTITRNTGPHFNGGVSPASWTVNATPGSAGANLHIVYGVSINTFWFQSVGTTGPGGQAPWCMYRFDKM